MRSQADASSFELGGWGKKLGVPTSEGDIPSKKLNVPTSEHGNSSSEGGNSSKKLGVPTSEHGNSSKKLDVSSSEGRGFELMLGTSGK
ncbi:MAG: hypothetical protein KME13_25165 [Myxacorys californica WJT36-NPBG1]|nr:hypothetical protein [Myxacorys californica WJT36-NPBG1]